MNVRFLFDRVISFCEIVANEACTVRSVGGTNSSTAGSDPIEDEEEDEDKFEDEDEEEDLLL